jgi:hypothetical protein
VDSSIFDVGFLDAEGVLIEVVSVSAVTLTSAAECAGEIAYEIGAANFLITPGQPSLGRSSASTRDAAQFEKRAATALTRKARRRLTDLRKFWRGKDWKLD